MLSRPFAISTHHGTSPLSTGEDKNRTRRRRRKPLIRKAFNPFVYDVYDVYRKRKKKEEGAHSSIRRCTRSGQSASVSSVPCFLFLCAAVDVDT